MGLPGGASTPGSVTGTTGVGGGSMVISSVGSAPSWTVSATACGTVARRALRRSVRGTRVGPREITRLRQTRRPLRNNSVLFTRSPTRLLVLCINTIQIRIMY